MSIAQFDVVIVGAGMVGASLALALAHTPLRIALVESHNLTTDQQPGYDARGIALSYGSQRIFETLGLWSSLAREATAIHTIHISDKGHFGVTRLTAEAENVPALGQVLSALSLGKQLNQRLQNAPTITLLSPRQVVALQQSKDAVTLTLDNQQTLESKLIVAADGQQSTIRQLLNLSVWQQDYQQTAITANVTPEKPHNHIAYERFTADGPVALLPMSDNRCSLIWTVKTGQEQALLAQSDDEFLAALQTHFGYRLGRFLRVGQRSHYPLRLMQTDQPVQQRVVLIGNAAHTLHPIAGQGFNLGLRDVAVLAEVLAKHTDDCGHARSLAAYQARQLRDQDKVIAATDGLVKLFSNANPILGHGRAAGLALLDLLPGLKSVLARQSMGLSGRQSRLSRGLRG